VLFQLLLSQVLLLVRWLHDHAPYLRYQYSCRVMQVQRWELLWLFQLRWLHFLARVKLSAHVHPCNPIPSFSPLCAGQLPLGWDVFVIGLATMSTFKFQVLNKLILH
jgi:hypothetical protein